MRTLKFIQRRYGIDLTQPSPITLPHGRQIELLKLYRKLGFKKGVEVGTASGIYALRMLKLCPDIHLYCVDPWLAYEYYTERPSYENDQAYMDGFFEKAKNRTARFGDRVTFIRKFSMDAVKDFADNSLDFVYIDGNHSFEYVVEDIAQWSKKVRPGGIIAGHDYWVSTRENSWLPPTATEEDIMKLCQVKEAVDAWTKANRISPWFVFTNDRSPSWWWVKE